MRFKQLMRYLKKWQQVGLISEEQVNKIADYMKVESHRQFSKLIRLLFIVGAFWLFFGLVAVLKLINVEILLAGIIVSVLCALGIMSWEAVIQ